jgi:hypothetical protein
MENTIAFKLAFFDSNATSLVKVWKEITVDLGFVSTDKKIIEISSHGELSKPDFNNMHLNNAFTPRIFCKPGIYSTPFEVLNYPVGLLQFFIFDKKKEEKVLASFRFLKSTDDAFCIYSPENHDKIWTKDNKDKFFKQVYYEVLPYAINHFNQ